MASKEKKAGDLPILLHIGSRPEMAVRWFEDIVVLDILSFEQHHTSTFSTYGLRIFELEIHRIDISYRQFMRALEINRSEHCLRISKISELAQR